MQFRSTLFRTACVVAVISGVALAQQGSSRSDGSPLSSPDGQRLTIDEDRGQEATSPDEEINVRYTAEYVYDMGVASTTTTRMTYYVKGSRQRIHVDGQPQFTIVQCDLRRQITVNPVRGTCCIQSFDQVETNTTPVGVAGLEGGVVSLEGEYVDTGERREIFGLESRRVAYKSITEADQRACSYRPGRVEIEGEAWIADLPRAARPYGCRSEGVVNVDVSMASGAPGCDDEIRREVRGDSGLLEGLVLVGSSSTTILGQTTTTVSSITELSFSPLDAALFEPPAGCKCDSEISR